jgi:hypothetical protein
MQANPLLTLGALLSAIAAVLHVCIVFKGASWYRFFGAGESFAVAAEQGKFWPPAITLGIALVLFSWSAYALSGAGLMRPLPLLPLALLAITGVYLLRGAVLIPLLLFARSKATPFLVWSSVVCLIYGIVHAVGLAQVWPRL